jgi:CBS domain-containing protein
MEKNRPRKVKEVMKRDVITVRPKESVRNIAGLLSERHIRSVPVVDENFRLVGIVTESDLFLKEKGMPFSSVKMPTLFERWADPDHLLEIYEQAGHHTALDVMTEKVITVGPEETIEQAAWLMFHHDLRALPVVEDKKLVGILTRGDFIRLLAKGE